MGKDDALSFHAVNCRNGKKYRKIAWRQSCRACNFLQKTRVIRVNQVAFRAAIRTKLQKMTNCSPNKFYWKFCTRKDWFYRVLPQFQTILAVDTWNNRLSSTSIKINKSSSCERIAKQNKTFLLIIRSSIQVYSDNNPPSTYSVCDRWLSILSVNTAVLWKFAKCPTAERTRNTNT